MERRSPGMMIRTISRSTKIGRPSCCERNACLIDSVKNCGTAGDFLASRLKSVSLIGSSQGNGRGDPKAAPPEASVLFDEGRPVDVGGDVAGHREGRPGGRAGGVLQHI